VLAGPVEPVSRVRSAIAAGWLKVCPGTPSEPDCRISTGRDGVHSHCLGARGRGVLLMDERAGRTLAVEHGLRVAGTRGIGMAKSRGLIRQQSSLRAVARVGFQISAEVIRTVLQALGVMTSPSVGLPPHNGPGRFAVRPRARLIRRAATQAARSTRGRGFFVLPEVIG